jgi:hypothetical protein
MSPKSGPKRLRELLKQPGIIRSLGAHDVFTALIVEQAGFETVFIGAGAARLQDRGLPHRIADGLRPGHARLVRHVEEHRSRGQAFYAGDEFRRG